MKSAQAHHSASQRSKKNTRGKSPRRSERADDKASIEKYGIAPHQSVELLKALHILTRDGKLNQDSRRKLKQIQHLVQFITPLLDSSYAEHGSVTVVDHGAGKSYLGFMLYDWYYVPQQVQGKVIGVERREDLVARSEELAQRFGFEGMEFHALAVEDTVRSPLMPERIDVVTALHACDTATDDAIAFGLAHDVEHMVLVPCCQAEVAALLRKQRSKLGTPLAALWKHPIHTREFGSHITNVLRTLQLQCHGYKVTVTELVGWEHSMKNELIVASKLPKANRASHARKAYQTMRDLLSSLSLDGLPLRFMPAVGTEYVVEYHDKPDGHGNKNALNFNKQVDA